MSRSLFIIAASFCSLALGAMVGGSGAMKSAAVNTPILMSTNQGVPVVEFVPPELAGEYTSGVRNERETSGGCGLATVGDWLVY